MIRVPAIQYGLFTALLILSCLSFAVPAGADVIGFNYIQSGKLSIESVAFPEAMPQSYIFTDTDTYGSKVRKVAFNNPRAYLGTVTLKYKPSCAVASEATFSASGMTGYFLNEAEITGILDAAKVGGGKGVALRIPAVFFSSIGDSRTELTPEDGRRVKVLCDAFADISIKNEADAGFIDKSLELSVNGIEVNDAETLASLKSSLSGDDARVTNLDFGFSNYGEGEKRFVPAQFHDGKKWGETVLINRVSLFSQTGASFKNPSSKEMANFIKNADSYLEVKKKFGEWLSARAFSDGLGFAGKGEVEPSSDITYTGIPPKPLPGSQKAETGKSYFYSVESAQIVGDGSRTFEPTEPARISPGTSASLKLVVSRTLAPAGEGSQEFKLDAVLSPVLGEPELYRYFKSLSQNGVPIGVKIPAYDDAKTDKSEVFPLTDGRLELKAGDSDFGDDGKAHVSIPLQWSEFAYVGVDYLLEVPKSSHAPQPSGGIEGNGAFLVALAQPLLVAGIGAPQKVSQHLLKIGDSVSFGPNKELRLADVSPQGANFESTPGFSLNDAIKLVAYSDSAKLDLVNLQDEFLVAASKPSPKDYQGIYSAEGLLDKIVVTILPLANAPVYVPNKALDGSDNSILQNPRIYRGGKMKPDAFPLGISVAADELSKITLKPGGAFDRLVVNYPADFQIASPSLGMRFKALRLHFNEPAIEVASSPDRSRLAYETSDAGRDAVGVPGIVDAYTSIRDLACESASLEEQIRSKKEELESLKSQLAEKGKAVQEKYAELGKLIDAQNSAIAAKESAKNILDNLNSKISLEEEVVSRLAAGDISSSGSSDGSTDGATGATPPAESEALKTARRTLADLKDGQERANSAYLEKITEGNEIEQALRQANEAHSALEIEVDSLEYKIAETGADVSTMEQRINECIPMKIGSAAIERIAFKGTEYWHGVKYIARPGDDPNLKRTSPPAAAGFYVVALEVGDTAARGKSRKAHAIVRLSDLSTTDEVAATTVCEEPSKQPPQSAPATTPAKSQAAGSSTKFREGTRFTLTNLRAGEFASLDGAGISNGALGLIVKVYARDENGKQAGTADVKFDSTGERLFNLGLHRLTPSASVQGPSTGEAPGTSTESPAPETPASTPGGAREKEAAPATGAGCVALTPTIKTMEEAKAANAAPNEDFKVGDLVRLKGSKNVPEELKDFSWLANQEDYALSRFIFKVVRLNPDGKITLKFWDYTNYAFTGIVNRIELNPKDFALVGRASEEYAVQEVENLKGSKIKFIFNRPVSGYEELFAVSFLITRDDKTIPIFKKISGSKIESEPNAISLDLSPLKLGPYHSVDGEELADAAFSRFYGIKIGNNTFLCEGDNCDTINWLSPEGEIEAGPLSETTSAAAAAASTGAATPTTAEAKAPAVVKPTCTAQKIPANWDEIETLLGCRVKLVTPPRSKDENGPDHYSNFWKVITGDDASKYSQKKLIDMKLVGTVTQAYLESEAKVLSANGSVETVPLDRRGAHADRLFRGSLAVQFDKAPNGKTFNFGAYRFELVSEQPAAPVQAPPGEEGTQAPPASSTGGGEVEDGGETGTAFVVGDRVKIAEGLSVQSDGLEDLYKYMKENSGKVTYVLSVADAGKAYGVGSLAVTLSADHFKENSPKWYNVAWDLSEADLTELKSSLIPLDRATGSNANTPFFESNEVGSFAVYDSGSSNQLVLYLLSGATLVDGAS